MANKNNNNKVSHRQMSVGQQRLQAYKENNNLRAVAIAIPRSLHHALYRMAQRGRRTGGASSKQALVTIACNAYYPSADIQSLPPLAQFEPSRSNVDGTGDPRFTWYADEDMLVNIRVIGARFSCSMRQLVISALLEHYKDEPEMKGLDFERGVDPSLRMPPATG